MLPCLRFCTFNIKRLHPIHSLGKHLMKIKLFEYVAAGHDLSHWNSDMCKKLCICDGWCPRHEIFARRLLLNNVFMLMLHYVWFQHVTFELYLLSFFLLKFFIFYLSLLHNKDDQFPWCYFFLFRCFQKLKYIISCMSTHLELLEWYVCCWNDEMWLVMHLWADKLTYIIPWVFPASRKDYRLVHAMHVFSLPCLFVAILCNVNRKIRS